MSSLTSKALKAGEDIYAAVRRFDGWRNLLTGLGTERDKSLASFPAISFILSPYVLEAMFTGDDFARRIVQTLPQEAFKLGFGLAKKGADPTEVEDEADELLTDCEQVYRLSDRFVEGMCWGRLHGLGALVIGAEGAGMPEEPLDDERVTAIQWLLPLDKRDLTPLQYYDDPTEDKFGEVELYTLQPSGSAVGAQVSGIAIHESRVLVFGGALTSRRERQRNQMADHSVLQAVFHVLQQANNNWSGVCHLMTDVSQGVFKLKDLMEMLSGGQKDLLDARLQMLDTGRSVARAIVLDADGEDFERVPTPLSGVPEIIEKTWQRLAAAAEMPLTVLMGVSPAGLNATGESDIRLWYDRIQKARAKVQPQLERMVRMIARVKGHDSPEDWSVTWPSLWQMSATEAADHRLKTAQADHIYMTDGVLLPEEVALSRFAHGPEFNAVITSIDVDARKAAMDRAVEELTNPPKPPPPVPPGALPPAPGQTQPADAQPVMAQPTPAVPAKE